jgi:hypothetical protein
MLPRTGPPAPEPENPGHNSPLSDCALKISKIFFWLQSLSPALNRRPIQN